MTANQLHQEKSLYLKQHADQPVHWYPWGTEAFERAQRENKPVIVSIGYASCHWCHVMARECFEDPYIAKLMNEHFVCIKVDREERPDLDQLYMEAVQMIIQRAGWPLNAFCLPNGKPFFGGTYFPAEDKGQGIVPWPQLLMRIATHFRDNPGELEENADNIVHNLKLANQLEDDTAPAWDPAALLTGADLICSAHDDEWGGFSQAPKFPPSMIVDFLLGVRSSRACEEKLPALAERIDQVVPRTLGLMARGGIFDQLGGGFSRYSVDRSWTVPHFEKMLYDNALLLDAYAKAYMRYCTPLFESVIRETAGWLSRELAAPEGGYYAAMDADTEGVEGRYYAWIPQEIFTVLGDEAGARFCAAYGISEEGNFEKGSSVPVFHEGGIDERNALSREREQLLQAREKRVQPAVDTKFKLSWNALVIRGLVEAAFALGETSWFEQARKSADFIWKHLCVDGGRLKSTYYESGGAVHTGTLADYAYYIEACLALAAKGDCFEVGISSEYLERAQVLMDVVLAHFGDSEKPGYFFVADDHEALPVRKKEWFDEALPSANASLIHGLSMLYSVTGEGRYVGALNSLKEAYAPLVSRTPSGIAHALSGLTQEALGIPVLKVVNQQDLTSVREALAAIPWRKIFIQSVQDASLPKGYQLCVGTECVSEIDSLEVLVAKI